MSLFEHYARELSRLRVAARDFAERHPESAANLFERGNDPDVERLLEGVAYIIAGFHERVDQTTTRLAQHLAEVVAPHLVRSLPAATIVHFEARANALTKRHTVERGRSLTSTPVDDTRCTFETTADVDLWPIEIAEIALHRLRGSNARLSLDLRLGKHGPLALAEPAPLRLFAAHHSDPTVAPTLLLWLSERLERIVVRDEGGAEHELAPEALQLISPTDLPVFPWPGTLSLGYRALVEYFAFPEKLHFFEVHGLHALGIKGSSFQLHFDFIDAPPLKTALDSRTLRLHCSPAINLFACHGEPIRRDPVTREYILRADDIDPRHAEVHDVTSATSLSSRRIPVTYLPFSNALPKSATYSLRRRRSERDGAIDTFISFTDPARSTGTDDVSLELQCTNRRLPERLGVGDVCGTSGQALFRSYTNISRVSPPIGLLLHSQSLWRIASYLAVGGAPPRDEGALRRMLEAFDFVGQERSSAALSSRRHIDAIRSLRTQPTTLTIGGAPYPGILVNIELNDEELGGPGGAFLFGRVLDALFGALTPLNTALKVRVRLAVSEMEFNTWPVHLGI